MTKSTAELIDDAARHIAEKVVSDDKLTAGEKVKGFASLIDYLKVSTAKNGNGAPAPEIEAFDTIRDRLNSMTFHPLDRLGQNGDESAN